MAIERALPTPDADSAPFWEGCQQEKLLLQHCKACDHTWYYPRIACPECGTMGGEWIESAGKGKVYSFTVVQRSAWAGLPAPYVVALVELKENVRVLSNIIDIAPDQVHIEMPVKVIFQKVSEEITLPLFRPA